METEIPATAPVTAGSAFFPANPEDAKTVFHHLIHKRKRKDERQARHEGTHQIIGDLYFASGKLCEKHCEVLTAVIIVHIPL